MALLILLSGAVVLTILVWVGVRPGASEHAVAFEGAVGDVDPIEQPNPARPPPSEDAGVESSGPSVPDDVVIHVSGQVNQPGLVILDGGGRVDDAVLAAGGPTATADLAALNLARIVVDGEQIYLPAVGEESRPPEATTDDPTGPGDQGGTQGDELVDLNRADAALLQTLPGVGPVMADRIVAHREQIGGFAAVTQLLEVPGIGPTRLAELQQLVRVGP